MGVPANVRERSRVATTSWRLTAQGHKTTTAGPAAAGARQALQRALWEGGGGRWTRDGRTVAHHDRRRHHLLRLARRAQLGAGWNRQSGVTRRRDPGDGRETRGGRDRQTHGPTNWERFERPHDSRAGSKHARYIHVSIFMTSVLSKS